MQLLFGGFRLGDFHVEFCWQMHDVIMTDASVLRVHWMVAYILHVIMAAKEMYNNANEMAIALISHPNNTGTQKVKSWNLLEPLLNPSEV